MNREDPRWRLFDRIGDAVLGLLLVAVPVLPFVPSASGPHERLVLVAFGVFVYLAVFALAAALFAKARRSPEATLPYRQSLARSWRWVRRWHGMVACGLLAGAIVGAFLAAVIGPLVGNSTPFLPRVLKGAGNGAFYLLIWTPGLSMILCMMQAFGPQTPLSEQSSPPD